MALGTIDSYTAICVNKFYCATEGRGIEELVLSADEIELHLPMHYTFLRNYPNPFAISTKIYYAIPASDFVTIKIYDTLGREQQTLISEFHTSGSYSINFNAADLAEGIYFYTLRVGNAIVETEKMLFLR